MGSTWQHAAMPFSFCPPTNPQGYRSSPLSSGPASWTREGGGNGVLGRTPTSPGGEAKRRTPHYCWGFLSATLSRREASGSAPQPPTSRSLPGRVRSPTPTSTRSPSPGSGQIFILEAKPLPAPHPQRQPERSPSTTPHPRLPAPTFPFGHPFGSCTTPPTSVHPAPVPSGPERLPSSPHLLSRPASSPRSLPVRPP